MYAAQSSKDIVSKLTISTGAITIIAGYDYAEGDDYYYSIGRYSGDGGAATSAELFLPSGVAVDFPGELEIMFSTIFLLPPFTFTGNVYIADTSNDCIRKVTISTGIITTVTSGLHSPRGVSVDLLGEYALFNLFPLLFFLHFIAIGNLFIVDSGSNCIRKVTILSGVIEVFAGSESNSGFYNGDKIAATSAVLSAPLGITLDKTGRE